MMNKHEAIKKVEQMGEYERFVNELIPKLSVLNILNQLDEPQKPTVPQCVADWIEESRTKGWDLLASMCFVLNAKNKKTTKWFYLGENKNIFALAWIFGYTVEKEKKYRVSLKNGQPLVKAPLGGNFYFNQNITCGKYKATRKELEEAGFGWVFDCPGVEIEEVEG